LASSLFRIFISSPALTTSFATATCGECRGKMSCCQWLWMRIPAYPTFVISRGLVRIVDQFAVDQSDPFGYLSD
jgi:hypothetical protein